MSKTQPSGWKGVCLVAITYVYFLIFAQFAFLKRLAILGIADEHLKAVMGAMAAGGILLSLVTPRVAWLPSPQRGSSGTRLVWGSRSVVPFAAWHRRKHGRLVPDRLRSRAANRHSRHLPDAMDWRQQSAAEGRSGNGRRLPDLQSSSILYRFVRGTGNRLRCALRSRNMHHSQPGRPDTSRARDG